MLKNADDHVSHGAASVLDSLKAGWRLRPQPCWRGRRHIGGQTQGQVLPQPWGAEVFVPSDHLGGTYSPAALRALEVPATGTQGLRVPASCLLPDTARSPRLIVQTRHHNSPSETQRGSPVFRQRLVPLTFANPPREQCSTARGRTGPQPPTLSVGTGFYRFHFMLP